MVKMIDVARHAGVSVKTVSRVLNNEPHVQDAMRTKVRKAVRELGYVPSASARSLRSRRSYRIHVVSHSLNSGFVHAIQFGALYACQMAGYSMTVSMLDLADAKNDQFLATWCENLTRDGKPDGVILVPPLSDDAVVNAAVADMGIAIVRIGPNDIADTNATVLIDDHAAARDATQHLIDLGHTRIGFVRGKEDQGATHERFRGYCDALRDAGVEPDPSLVQPGLFDFETGLAAGNAFLEMADPPTAVFAANDDMAAGVLVAAHRHQVGVPSGLSIVGFDDSEIAKKMWPALTTVRQPLQGFGARAMEVLTQMLGRNGGRETGFIENLPYEMVLRQSTGPAPSRDRGRAAARGDLTT